MTTAEKDSKGGLASWLIGQHQLPADDQLVATPTEQPVVEQKPVVQNSPVEEPVAAPAPKKTKKTKTKIVKKAPKKKTPQPINPDECQEIEIERDGQDITLLLPHR